MKRILAAIVAVCSGFACNPAPAQNQITTRTAVPYVGDYSATTPYTIQDMVTYGGTSYVSLVKNNIGNTPDVSPSSWKQLVSPAAKSGVTSFNGRSGSVVPLASDYSGFFTTPAQAAAAAPVHSVNGQTGDVVISTSGSGGSGLVDTSCQGQIGGGPAALSAGTYTVLCFNDSGQTWTLKGLHAYADAGSSTISAKNAEGTSLLSSAVTAGPSFPAGSLAVTSLASGDYILMTIVADGVSQSIMPVFTITHPAVDGSETGAASFTVPTVAIPTFSPAPGSYTGSQNVTLADATSGASIHYTVDGSTPTSGSPTYTGPLGITSTTTIKALATEAGYVTSGVLSGTYTIVAATAAATPTASPAAGTFSSAQTVTLADATSGATIRYTTDGSTPTGSSAIYSAPITVSSSKTINAIATAPGYAQSAQLTAAYAIQQAQAAATPVASPVGGAYTGTQTVTLTDSTPGSVIHYTVDGTTPTAASSVYTSPITVSATQTVSAIAVASSYTNSSVLTSTYTITPAQSGGAIGQAFSDTFQYAAGDLATNSGGNWTYNGGAAMYIQGNSYGITPNATDGQYHVLRWSGAGTPNANQYATMVFTRWDGGVLGPAVRVSTSGASTGYSLACSPSGGACAISKTVAGSQNNLTSYGALISLGDIVELDVTGTTTTVLTVYVTHAGTKTQYLTYTDTNSPILTGTWGMGAYGGNGNGTFASSETGGNL